MVVRSEGWIKPKSRASATEVDTVALATSSKFFCSAAKISMPSPRASGRMELAGRDRGKRKLFASAAPWNQADTGLDQAHVELRVGLARGGVHGHLATAAERHAVGRNDHRTRAELDRLGHALELLDGVGNVIPFRFLDGEHELASGSLRPRNWLSRQ